MREVTYDNRILDVEPAHFEVIQRQLNVDHVSRSDDLVAVGANRGISWRLTWRNASPPDLSRTALWSPSITRCGRPLSSPPRVAPV